jgi:type IV secretory pathway protease TraF
MLLRVSRAARSLGGALLGLPRQAATALGAGGAECEPRPARFWLATGIVLPIAGAAALVLPQLTLVMSPSINALLLRESPGVIRRGDLVSFFLSHPLAGPRPVRVTKYALCLPGERIDWLEKPVMAMHGAWEGWYYCEDRFLGISKPVGHDGRRLAHWRPLYRFIPPGFVYVGSAHPSGFDSRYYGPVPIDRLNRMEKIL